MNRDASPGLRLELCNDPDLGRIEVSMDSFLEFSFWMAEELSDLVAANRTSEDVRANRDAWMAQSRPGLRGHDREF